MKREIKFRGKRKDNGEWVEGCYQRLVIHGLMRYFILPANSLVFDNVKLIDALIEVIPETVSQFTELFDKNGKEIYEGDIIVANRYPFFDEGKPNYIGIVVWFENTFSFGYEYKLVNKDRRGISDGIGNELDEDEEYEIIGNIHQNKELIK